MHNSAARDQRVAIASYIKEYGNKLALNGAPLPNRIIPEYMDDSDSDNPDAEEAAACEVKLMAEDFGQGMPIPHYGLNRPASDYFNSNLMLHMFVMADITRRKHNVKLYDERLMGKDKDALCSLRIAHHIEDRQECLELNQTPPKYFISIRDNCVGQNKSNITLNFECFLAMTFYKRILLIYLIPGHSHMVTDRVVSWAKKS